MTNRKGIGRNLFSATKKWFGSNKPNQGQTIVAEKTNVVYVVLEFVIWIDLLLYACTEILFIA